VFSDLDDRPQLGRSRPGTQRRSQPPRRAAESTIVLVDFACIRLRVLGWLGVFVTEYTGFASFHSSAHETSFQSQPEAKTKKFGKKQRMKGSKQCIACQHALAA
jgi:hypothetical protein